MCDLSSEVKVRNKTVTVYKICVERDGRYFAALSGLEIKVGKVADLEFVPERKMKVAETLLFSSDKIIRILDWVIRLYGERSQFYNELAVGRTTGFNSEKIARLAAKDFEIKTILLKLKLTGDLVQGTGKGMGDYSVVDRARVYAGREILSVEKI